MKINYIARKAADFSYAKEMRLYAADSWLMPKYKGLLRERRMWKGKQIGQQMRNNTLWNVVEMVKQVVVYTFLIAGVLQGRVGADDFVLYLGLALSLSNSMSRLANAVSQVRSNMLSIADYRRMMNLPDSGRRGEAQGQSGEGSRENRQEQAVEGVSGKAQACTAGRAPEITFSHLAFAYPGTAEDTLKDVDISIKPGEKIALVGLNGAGKTTLVKLLCGMYEPTKGEILLDGKPSTDWPLEDWYRLFSAVFQDIGVIPATIAENVAACAPEEADQERVQECLRKAGLWELVESLPRGMDTCLQKEMFREGVNLSGGETQKLLLARAIYREAPILVLDEPTAALDAIAENQMYLRYNELTRGRTSLFISHRLSSTRFCDRIWMMEGGRISEVGTHEELMEKKGAYYELFRIQSHYYQKDRTEGFSSRMDPSWEVSSYVSN